MADGTLARRIVTGAGWSGIARIVIQGCALAATAVIARRVPPSAYGTVGMATIVTGLVMLFRDLGSAAAVIQKRDLNQTFLSSLFWLNVAMGLFGTSVCFLSAPFVAVFFREPTVVPILRVLSTSFCITSLSTIHSALMNRSMDFRRISLIEISSAVAGFLMAVTFAAMNAGVWSLVAGSLTHAAAGSVLFMMVSRWRPRFLFSLPEIRSVMSFGLNLSAFNVVNYFARNADNTIVGRYLGSSQLGFYQLAYNIMLFPVTGITHLLARVLFPAFSEIQQDNERFCRVYLRACSSIALVTFPLMTGAAILAGPLISTLYGPRWVGATPVLMILAPVGMVQSVVTVVGQIYQAKGRADLMFQVGGVCSVLYVISFVAGLPWGIAGVASSYAICTAILLVPTLLIPFNLIGLSIVELLVVLRPIASSTLLMAVVIVVTRKLILSYWRLPAVADVLLFTTIGAITYGATVFLRRVPGFIDIIQMIGSMRPAFIPSWFLRARTRGGENLNGSKSHGTIDE